MVRMCEWSLPQLPAPQIPATTSAPQILTQSYCAGAKRKEKPGVLLLDQSPPSLGLLSPRSMESFLQENMQEGPGNIVD